MRAESDKRRAVAPSPETGRLHGRTIQSVAVKYCLPGVSGRLLLILPLFLFLSLWADLRPAHPQAVRGRTWSPHGPLALACENCHTSTSWKPIRSIPDFNHNETRFPLRGLHMSVDCRRCHTRLLLSDVGTKCADCHADIHRRQFGGKCDACHTVRGWRISLQSVKQHENRFPLLGAHAAIDCDSCHKGAASGQFVGLSTECVSCHLRDYQATRGLDHQSAKLPVKCDECHRFDSWHGTAFDHARFTGFELSGAHARLDCAGCHPGGRFAGTPANCFSCHAGDFTGATDPNHVTGGFPHDCSACHNSTSWVGAMFDHGARTRFTLTGTHAQVGCNQCHVAGRYAGTSQDCYGCHMRSYEATKNPDHKKAGLPTDCSGCHSTQRWQGAQFDHSIIRFPLTGAHATVACNACHSGGAFADASPACVSCHLAAFTNARNPNHDAAGFPQDCSLCHNTTQWKGAKFDHDTASKFPLTGSHGSVSCTSCHKNNLFQGTSASCVSCHLTQFNNTGNPNHTAAGFSQDCVICHTTAQWKGAKFDHSRTQFPLTGAHNPIDCERCHSGGQFAGLNAACASCHLADFSNTKNPNHLVAGFPQDCSICHTTTQWQGAKFDHTTATKFPLTGSHVRAACADCHTNNIFLGLATNCVSCHLADFNGTTNPDHAVAGFPQDCLVCHTTTQWQGTKFDHNMATKFPLTGAHATAACAECHKNNVFSGLSTGCASCHLADYNQSTNPNHAAAGFPQDCSVCHTTTQWRGTRFDHNTATKFPLTGAHLSAACADCHKNNIFSGLSITCASCHLADYNQTTNPNHAVAGFPQDCSICHTTIQWKGAVFDHGRTGFILTGGHLRASCIQCHAGNRFGGTPTQCSGCHLADYSRTTNPNHAAAGFPQDCSVCHGTTTWVGATFNHSNSRFPLTGAHVNVQCSTCHKNGVFNGLSTSCISCHLADFTGTTNPNHVAAGFPQDCSICHTTTRWAGATFNHSNSRFPLTGAHLKVQCVSCHVGGKYAGTPTDCYFCHQKEYTSTTSPNHIAAGLPHDCSLCHTTTTWSGATFSHTWFPVYSGSHRGRWTTCGDCHTNSSNYSVFSCTTCHAHDKTRMDQKHAGIRNYVYNSANCYSCHPTGREG